MYFKIFSTVWSDEQLPFLDETDVQVQVADAYYPNVGWGFWIGRWQKYLQYF